jgi:hypothetical protein
LRSSKDLGEIQNVVDQKLKTNAELVQYAIRHGIIAV